LEALFDSQNSSGDPATTMMKATYLRVTVCRA